MFCAGMSDQKDLFEHPLFTAQTVALVARQPGHGVHGGRRMVVWVRYGKFNCIGLVIGLGMLLNLFFDRPGGSAPCHC
jgi:hypothetical protein